MCGTAIVFIKARAQIASCCSRAGQSIYPVRVTGILACINFVFGLISFPTMTRASAGKAQAGDKGFAVLFSQEAVSG